MVKICEDDEHGAEMISKNIVIFWLMLLWFKNIFTFGSPSCFVCEISIHLIASLEAFDLDGFHYLDQQDPWSELWYNERFRDFERCESSNDMISIYNYLSKFWYVQVIIVSYFFTVQLPAGCFSTIFCHPRHDQLNGSIIRRGETWWFLVVVLSPSHQKVSCKGCVSHHIVAWICEWNGVILMVKTTIPAFTRMPKFHRMWGDGSTFEENHEVFRSQKS